MDTPESPPACCACGGADLVPHFAVSGDAGAPGLVPTTDRFGVALADVVRCTNCGHMQLERMPVGADLAEAYAEAESSDYLEEEAGQRVTAARILERVEAHTGGPGRLVDLGCWVGLLALVATERGWEAVGVDPSEFASRYARERFNLDVRTGDLLTEPLPERTFDAVVMADVLEHLPDPGEALDRAARLLSPTGALVLALPDAGSRLARAMGRRWWSVIPTHVQYFTRASLRLLLRRRGFEVLEEATAPKAFTVRYYLGRLTGYRPWLGRAAVRTAEGLGLADRLWAPDFRDRALVIARPVAEPR